MNSPFKPVILGLSGSKISKKEYFLFKKHLPLGYIIFTRNIENFSQLKNLITQLRSINPNKKTFIMIDHEGGRVNRFLNFFNQFNYSAKIFGDHFRGNKKIFKKQMSKFINFNSNLFNYLGIDLVAAPVLDLFHKNKSDVIGDRAYSSNVREVQSIAKIVISEYKKKGIYTVGKHVPGHGLSDQDSHFVLPIVRESKQFLMNNDFACFKNINPHFFMTAHIVYEKFDKNNPATFSSTIINDLIKKDFKYRGIVMSDDICMKALSGSIEERARKSLEAGCDIVLHCNGNFKEMTKLLNAVKPANDLLLAKMIKIFNYHL